MNTTLESVERAANQLSASERAALAQRLLKDLDESEGDESQIESLWAIEGEDRLDAYNRGELESSPLEDVLERVRAEIGK